MEPTFADFYRTSRVRRLWAPVRRFWKWLVGIGIGALAAFLSAYFAGLLGVFLPPPTNDVTCRVREWFYSPAPGSHFTILISNLAGDESGAQTKRVRNVFLYQRGVDVRVTCRVVELNAAGGSLAGAEAAALEYGWNLLNGWNADLLIWGEVKKADEELNLWFLNREGRFSVEDSSYSIDRKLTLSADFRVDLAAQLRAIAFSQIVPRTPVDGDHLLTLLRPATMKFRRFLSEGGELAERKDAALLYRFGEAAAQIGVYMKDREWLTEATAAYNQVLSEWTRSGVPWAGRRLNKVSQMYFIRLHCSPKTSPYYASRRKHISARLRCGCSLR